MKKFQYVFFDDYNKHEIQISRGRMGMRAVLNFLGIHAFHGVEAGYPVRFRDRPLTPCPSLYGKSKIRMSDENATKVIR